jgi:L-fuculose-phosphate aldolase
MPYTQTQQEDLVWIALDRDAATIEAALGEADPGSAEPLVRGLHQPSSEWRFHRDIYLSRPEINAIVHVHSPYATALACTRRDIPPFHYMIAAAGGANVRCAPYATFGTQALSDHAVAALIDRRACLLANHGLVALGADLERARRTAVEVEELARQYLLAEQTGHLVLLSASEIDEAMAMFSSYGQQKT